MGNSRAASGSSEKNWFAPKATTAFFADPDNFLQQPFNGVEEVIYLLPHVEYALDQAWQAYVESEKSSAVRTAAIRSTFGRQQESKVNSKHVLLAAD